MRVSLDTYGGLAGGIGGAPVVVDTDELSEEARNELRRLISAAAAAARRDGPEVAAADQVRDAQTYEITIDDEGNSAVLAATDGTVSEEFAQLRDFLRNHQPGG